MSKKKVVDPRFAKDEGYSRVISDIKQKGKCPFCHDDFKYHKERIIHSIGSWFITKNSWPYESSLHHFIILNDKEDKETVEELVDEDMLMIFKLIKWAVKEFDIPGGGMAMRFGETDYTGATVCHIHFHLIVPKKGETVNFPIG